MIELDTIYNEDCLEGMKRIPDGSVDMVLCDLPYGTTANAWDVRIPFGPLWEHYKRVCKHNAAILLFAQMPFGSDLIQSNRKMFRYEWVWEKSVGMGFFNVNRMPLRCHENVLVFYRKLPTYNPQKGKGEPYTKRTNAKARVYSNAERTPTVNDGSRYPRDVLKFTSEGSLAGAVGKNLLHPTQKPVALCEYLVKTYTNEGETVLDNCMGSGTTAIACINANRRFIGFETDKGYFEASQERIAQALEARAAGGQP